MSLVENLINQISTGELGGITKPQGFDLSDDSFAKLLEKQLNSVNDGNQDNLLGNMGIPAGMIIESIDGVSGVDFAETAQDQLEIVGEKNLINETQSAELGFSDFNAESQIKDFNIGDYFSNLLKENSSQNPSLRNFAQRHASNAYGVFGRSFVADLSDFVSDVSSML